MFEKKSVRRACAAVVLCAALAAGPMQGQEAPKKGGSVPITFVPPPLENATYSVGIYEVKTGKLARRLCEAAGQNTFKVGLNGLITSWDGKDDDGKALPPGRYAARGYAVGTLKVEGEAILGNDWAQDGEDLRVLRIEKIACVPEDEGLAAILNVGSDRWVVARFKGSDGSLVWQKPVAAPFQTLGATNVAICGLEASGEGLIVTGPDKKRTEYHLADGAAHALPTSSAALPDGKTALGKNESVWKIEDGVLSQHSLKGEVLRSLEPKKDDLLPVAVAASTKSERLYLLEKKEGWQRVRGLAWVDTKEESGKPVSTWQTFFERNIRPPDPATGLEDAATASGPSPTVEVPLAENPLAPGKSETVKLTATFDDKGSYLSTADALRLRQISQRGALRAVKLTRDQANGGLTFFQTDGAAWDQFSVRGVKEIASFEAGEFEIDAAGEKPTAEKAPEPDL